MDADLARPEDIGALPVEQRGQVITRALEESKSWLAIATQGTDPTPIAEFRAWAATVSEMTRQKGLAEEIQLDALEMVRRADRGIGLSIRKGQEAGEIRRVGESSGPTEDYVRNGQVVRVNRAAVPIEKKLSPSDFFKGGGEMSATYDMVDGVTDEAFESALKEGRAEKNLARANIARKAQGAAGPLSRAQKAERIREMAAAGYSSRQMTDSLGTADTTIRSIARDHGVDIPADRVMAGTRRQNVNPHRVVQETINTIQGVEYGLGLLSQADYDTFTPEQVRAWLGDLRAPMAALKTLLRELNRTCLTPR